MQWLCGAAVVNREFVCTHRKSKGKNHPNERMMLNFSEEKLDGLNKNRFKEIKPIKMFSTLVPPQSGLKTPQN